MQGDVQKVPRAAPCARRRLALARIRPLLELVPHLALAVVATCAAWRTSGWPANHELYSAFERVEAYRRAWAAGDWLPLWTPFSHNGHGSPMLFFYHRLFNTVAAALTMAAGSTYLGVKLAVTAMTFVGAVGMDRAVATFTTSRALRLCAAALLVFSNYALIDWLVRSAMAEFSAFMLVPWAYAYAIRAARCERVGWRLGLVLALLFYAHSAMAYYAFMIPLAAFAAGAASARDARARRALATTFAVAGLCFTLLVGPYVLAIGLTSPLFSLDALKRTWSPVDTMQPMRRYLYDAEFRWGRQWQRHPVEVGRAPVAAAALVVLLAAVRRSASDRRVAFVVGATLALCVFLQTAKAKWFYLHVPGAFYLGFPWRLLALITTATILALVGGVHALTRWSRAGSPSAWFARAALAAAVAYQVAFSLSAQDVRYEHYARAEIDAHLRDLDMATVGEYLPRLVDLHRIPAREPLVARSTCDAYRLTPRAPDARAHLRRLTVTVASSRACVVSLNQFATPFLAVEGDGVTARPSASRELDLWFSPGRHEAVVRTRGLFELIRVGLAARQ